MEKVYVTKTFLPPIEEYQQYIQQIWEKNQLTNQGPLLLEFEKTMKDYLGLDDFHFVTNGTLALMVSLKALNIRDGEVITTPFSYVATTSAILWERCHPVFVDIEPDTLSIDASKIEAAITDKTKAILAVHVFGNVCDIEKIEAIAKKHKLKVIYDAAHAFGVKYKGKSVLSYGDISICSFHSTKLYHTIEGGSVTANKKVVSDRIELIKRFGHNNDDHYMLGINAKASEFQAAMGLCNFKYIDQITKRRKEVVDLYDKLLGHPFERPKTRAGATQNYAYYAIILKSEEQLLKKLKTLNKKNIFPRRYFYPSLNTLPYLKDVQSSPISEDISKRIMCLPLSADLDPNMVRVICKELMK